ncbi:flagellar protein FlaG [Treponema brennaborense]|uniref:Flagellar protein FlaG protein n=1 Tax=Treponema brennaborense (strain DSM 12168 / CIP 105900 / DD5/3) TaxID=906968 RepID=F4LPA7_TREBD|nr:flagellar protein FlaG [Treponema brennaborense]AEE16969.1 flagellar protein FlaG protein [Treponema brennaborense DSM 12168]
MSVMNAIGQTLATDGRSYYNTDVTAKEKKGSAQFQNIMQDSGKVAESIVKNLAETQQDIIELQKLSDSLGREVRFKVNEELGQVVVKIVDPSTDKVIKEIPSADIQHLQIKIREAIGLLVDEQI